MKRELRRPTDVASERQERERGASDAEALLHELSHPAVGLATEAALADEPALRRVVHLVAEQVPTPTIVMYTVIVLRISLTGTLTGFQHETV